LLLLLVEEEGEDLLSKVGRPPLERGRPSEREGPGPGREEEEEEEEEGSAYGSRRGTDILVRGLSRVDAQMNDQSLMSWVRAKGG
jgi:hypothetical protein